MSTGIKLQEFKIPDLPESFDKGLDYLTDLGKSAIEKTSQVITGVADKITEQVQEPSTYNSTSKPVDFNSIAQIDGDIFVFGGMMPLPGSYTMNYKTPCKENQYNTEVRDYLNSVKNEQMGISRVFSEMGALFNYQNQRDREIFIKRNVPVTCTPKMPKKSGRKTRKIGESCVDDRECIVSDTRNKPQCQKAMRDKYLTGICNEIILGQGNKCVNSKDCKSDLLQCVNKKCLSKKRRLDSTNKTRRKVRVNIPLENYKGLGSLVKR